MGTMGEKINRKIRGTRTKEYWKILEKVTERKQKININEMEQ